MTKILVLLSLILTFNVSAYAFSDFAIALGARSNTWDTSVSLPGLSSSGNTGFQAGVLGFLDMAPSLQFRSGLLFTQRVFSTTVAGSETDYTNMYLDVPLTFRYMFAEYAGVFAGGVVALNVSKSANNGGPTEGVQSAPVGYQFGVSFKFASQLGAELYYEALPGTIQKNIVTAGSNINGQNAKSVVANLLITFE